MLNRLRLFDVTRHWFSLCLFATLVSSSAQAADWLHWRGPIQSGYSPEKNLPDEWDPRVVGKNNLVWKQPYGCRSTPLIMAGHVYIIGADNEPLGVPTLKEKQMIGERVTCFDANTGVKKWEHTFNVFHTDIVANRLGWSPMAGDAENKRVYAHSTAGFLMCFDATSGKVLWQRQLTEEFGRVTGYGGRVGGGPIFDSGLIIMGLVNGSWGNHAIGTNRFYAFDASNGKVVWTTEVPNQLRGTYYSNPVVAVINGQRLLISGGADGAFHAFQVRTGKRVWSYSCAVGVINPSPVVDGNFVYVAHGEENPEGASAGLGRVVCVDASKIVNGKPTLVWEYKKGIRFGLASLAIHDGKLYVPDDGAKLFCFDAKKGGNPKWKYNYGTVSRGAPLIADGKIYISETNFKFHIIKLKEDGSEPSEDETHTITFRNKPGASGFVESNSTPSVADGKVYLATRDELYCISKGGKPEVGETLKLPAEKPAGESDEIAQLQIYPAEIAIKSGETAEFELRAYNANGQLLKSAPLAASWSLPVPPLPKGATMPPPALDAVIDEKTGKITVNPKKPSQQGYVQATFGMLSARARVRVVAQIPYSQDFEKVPVGAVPGGWLNTQGKYRVVSQPDANGKPSNVLMKVNTDPRPPLARALGYITSPNETNYTIQADLKAVAVRNKLPDLGVCANRYILILDGKTDEKGQRQVRITTWEALPTPLPAGRIATETAFNWQDKTWYRVKLSVDVGEKETTVRGKIWDATKPEPEAWSMEFKDPRPNKEGAAAVYGYISNVTESEAGSEAYYDNVSITPNKK
ncbi:MAG: PQQ-like beta-propeller repeat protein [Planctomycetes bacterium]|nr:PQQ-like beta-propeller repeat protein [Planctomycetota bacterium]